VPMTFLEVPTGIRDDAKQRLVEELTAALAEAYHDPSDDYRIFFREHPPANVGQNGSLGGGPVGPVYFIEGPPLPDIDARRRLIAQLDSAIADAYQEIANTRDIMILINEYLLENAGSGGRLTSDDDAIVAATEARGARQWR
jgi:phenylpyruvate tautomerase PptA (4-oxalocrotonate tautomerase family)